MLVLLIGVNLANASVPVPEGFDEDAPDLPDPTLPADPDQPVETLAPIDPGPVEQGQAIDVGAGYTIQAPAGWTVLNQENDVTVLQKGDVVLVIGGVPTSESPEDLATWYRDAWFADGGVTSGEPVSRQIGNAIPAAELDYTGTFQGTQVDGRIVTGSTAGAGLLVNALAPTGSLAAAFPELESILGSVRLGGS
jgi:hypothetical protein